eukprot:scaffold1005_cov70-Cyclotella_meneghiniana.AAC.7
MKPKVLDSDEPRYERRLLVLIFYGAMIMINDDSATLQKVSKREVAIIRLLVFLPPTAQRQQLTLLCPVKAGCLRRRYTSAPSTGELDGLLCNSPWYHSLNAISG